MRGADSSAPLRVDASAHLVARIRTEASHRRAAPHDERVARYVGDGGAAADAELNSGNELPAKNVGATVVIDEVADEGAVEVVIQILSRAAAGAQGLIRAAAGRAVLPDAIDHARDVG